jgi:hypothetical protein
MADAPYERPARLMQHTSNDDLETAIGPLIGAMLAIGLTLLGAGALVVALAF